MNKIEKLMSKWWFRLVLIVAFSLLLFIVGMLLIPNDRETVQYANDGVLTITDIVLCSLASILMYFATDVLDNLRLKIGKFFRKLILLISLGLFILALLIGLGTYIVNVNGGKVIQPVFDGIGLAPFMTYTILYFFVVGKFEVLDDKEPNRKKQFILTLVALIAPVIVGIVLALVLNVIGNATVALIILIIFALVIVIAFISSIKKYGLFLGGTKEYDREKPVNTDTTSSDSTFSGGEWETKFVSEIEKQAYGPYTSVSVYASLLHGCVTVDVKVDYFGGTSYSDPKYILKTKNDIANQIRRCYKKIAKQCPYSSELNIKFED